MTLYTVHNSLYIPVWLVFRHVVTDRFVLEPSFINTVQGDKGEKGVNGTTGEVGRTGFPGIKVLYIYIRIILACRSGTVLTILYTCAYVHVFCTGMCMHAYVHSFAYVCMCTRVCCVCICVYVCVGRCWRHGREGPERNEGMDGSQGSIVLYFHFHKHHNSKVPMFTYKPLSSDYIHVLTISH